MKTLLRRPLIERRGRKRKLRCKGAVVFMLCVLAVIGYVGHQTKIAELATVKAQVLEDQHQQDNQRLVDLAQQNALLKIETGQLRTIANQPVDEKAPDFRKVVKAKTMIAALDAFGPQHLAAFEDLIGNKESGFNPYAINPTSGACGIFQALPCSKMGGTDVETQIKWGIQYLAQRYGNPTKALEFWNNNKATTGNGWY